MYQLRKTQLIKADLQITWDFFSSPLNLEKITPPDMGFHVKTELPEKMYEGLMIEYTVRPLYSYELDYRNQNSKRARVFCR